MRTMKAILITAIVGVGFLFAGGNAFATDAVTVSANNNDKKVKVQVLQPKLQDISVMVADADGNVIFNENIRAKTTYGKVYDLSNLEDGIYTFTSSGEYITTTKKIMVEGSTAREISKEATFKPVISLKDNYLKVHFFNKERGDIEFTIEGSNAIFHESKAGNDIVYGEMIDVSRMPKGKYYAKVKVGNKSYYHPFERP